MSTRLVVSLAACAALALACAPRSRASTTDADQPTTAADTTIGTLATSFVPARVGEALTFAVTMENTGASMLELRFPSGYTHDFVVYDAAEREVWRWSEGRMFTQTLQTKQLKRGDALRWEAAWADAPPGRYTVVAMVVSETHPHELRREVILQ